MDHNVKSFSVFRISVFMTRRCTKELGLGLTETFLIYSYLFNGTDNNSSVSQGICISGCLFA